MRLINTTTLELGEYIGWRDTPRYAILSHRWGDDEVSYKDFLKGRKRDGNGFLKIQHACRQALQDGYDHIWVDTCCIDKRSSAELSEASRRNCMELREGKELSPRLCRVQAINSMFSYYSRARVCYAFLADVYPLSPLDQAETITARLAASSWFTRGWTLQELIAPRRVKFFDRDWTFFGDKCSAFLPPGSLNAVLAGITGIPESVLRDRESMYHQSVADRFSWASRRITTRVEDASYCLLGIFNINMPLLYGESETAFLRLQREILARFDDDSILAWRTFQESEGLMPSPRGVLARLPGEFYPISRIRTLDSHHRPPFTLTNRGIEIRVPAGRSSGAYRDVDDPNQVYLFLNCAKRPGAFPYVLCLRYLPHCRHYARKALLDDTDFEAVDFRTVGVPFETEEVMYLHMSWLDEVYCSTHASLGPQV
ncbi:hypothetical protein LTR53_016246 [Teratosphaeriaceae sp. CCFEE 6253]|nr:hypothetical protein LTR53_016246 [Teratosphaeriaceae sp. CCFEE 6253]